VRKFLDTDFKYLLLLPTYTLIKQDPLFNQKNFQSPFPIIPREKILNNIFSRGATGFRPRRIRLRRKIKNRSVKRLENITKSQTVIRFVLYD